MAVAAQAARAARRYPHLLRPRIHAGQYPLRADDRARQHGAGGARRTEVEQLLAAEQADHPVDHGRGEGGEPVPARRRARRSPRRSALRARRRRRFSPKSASARTSSRTRANSLARRRRDHPPAGPAAASGRRPFPRDRSAARAPSRAARLLLRSIILLQARRALALAPGRRRRALALLRRHTACALHRDGAAHDVCLYVSRPELEGKRSAETARVLRHPAACHDAARR